MRVALGYSAAEPVSNAPQPVNRETHRGIFPLSRTTTGAHQILL